MLNVSTSITVDKTKELWEDLLALTKKQVLVGVPEENDSREEGQKIGNAALAYIHDNGSPAQGIPPRPFMQPGISKAQDRINTELLQVAKAQLNNNQDEVDKHLNNAGLVASASIKRVINEGENFTPLKYATLLARMRKRKSYIGKRKKLAKLKSRGDRTGYDQLAGDMADIMESFHPLVDTGNFRNSIGYVVMEKE